MFLTSKKVCVRQPVRRSAGSAVEAGLSGSLAMSQAGRAERCRATQV